MKMLVVPVAGIAGLALLGAGAGAAAANPRPSTSYLAVVRGAVVTQGFGCTAFALEPVAPECPSGHIHTGIDLAAPTGTPVMAAGGGVASVVYSSGGYGIHVILRHDARMQTLYGHLSAAAAQDGHWVEAGEILGYIGSTGMSTGPHLHLEVRRDGRPVDPRQWLPLPPAPETRRVPGS